jgi:LPXTG-motif cell wall-anchored protein
MAWNQPNKNYPKQATKKTGKKNFLFLLLGVLLVSILFVVFKSENKERTNIVEEQSHRKAETGVTKHISAPEEHVATDKKDNEPIKEEPPKTLHQRLAKRQFGVGNNVYTAKVNRVRSEYEVFKHRSENHLAVLMTVPLGTSLVGSKKYTPRFMDDLKKALEERVEISDNDSPEIKELKMSVESVKDQIRELMKKGEDIPSLLTQTFNEIQKMGAIKKTLEGEIRKANRDSKITDEDMEDLVQAANKMLEEKGISPISYNPVTRSIFRSRLAVTRGKKE